MQITMSVQLTMVAVTTIVLTMEDTMFAVVMMAMFFNKMERHASVRQVATIIITDFFFK